MIMNPITDPAVRLNDEFVKALVERYEQYADGARKTELDPGDYSERFANVCDLVVQLLWPEKYGTGTSDPHRHTSDPARTIAGLMMTAAGLQPQF